MNKIFHIGDRVWPVKVDGSQCDATKEDMSLLYGVVVGLSLGLSDDDRRYSVEWLDARTNEPAEFDHGLKNSWFEVNELSSALDGYINMLNSLSFDEEDDDDLNEIVTELCDVIDDRLIDLCNIYGLDYCEYSDIVIEKLFERLK